MINAKKLRGVINKEEFEEHPIEDSAKGPCHIYSVNNIVYPEAPSDFMKDGRFDLEQYSICLLKTVLMLPAHLLSPFLDYQCNQLMRPYKWLFIFDFLLIDNNCHKLSKVHEKRIKILCDLVSEKNALWLAYVNDAFPVDIFSAALVDEVRAKYNFDLVMQEMETKNTWEEKERFLCKRMEDYALEVEWEGTEEGFISLIKEQIEILERSRPPEKEPTPEELEDRSIFDGPEIDLANYFSEYRRVIDASGKLMCKDSTNHFVELICNGHVRPDGSSFDPEIILNYLENYDKSKGRFWNLKSTLSRA